ncbi:MAG: hypothetical protein ACK4GN_11805 [Runella sp.]
MTKLSCSLKIILLIISPLFVFSQQNLFNIPAGDLTPEGRFFYQHQTNLYPDLTTESKNHLVYGLKRNWEIGVNFQNIKIDWLDDDGNGEMLYTNGKDNSKPLMPLLQFTAQKFFFLGKNFKTTIGTQIGTNVKHFRATPHLTHFTYNLWVYEPAHHTKFVVGPYITDRRTVGRGNTTGVMVGFEVPVHKRLLIMGDWISGRNSASVGVLGINYFLTKRIQLCLGALLPNPRTDSKPGVVFELNLLGFDDN